MMNQNSQSSTIVAPSGKGGHSKPIASGKKNNLKRSFGVPNNTKKSSLFGSNPRLISHNKSVQNYSIWKKNYWNFEPQSKETLQSHSTEKRYLGQRGEQSKNQMIKESLQNSSSSFKDTGAKARILQKAKGNNKYLFSKLLSSIDKQSQVSGSDEISFKSPENASSDSEDSSSSLSQIERTNSQIDENQSIQDSFDEEAPFAIKPQFGQISDKNFQQEEFLERFDGQNFGQFEYDCQYVPTQHAQSWTDNDCLPQGYPLPDTNFQQIYARQQFQQSSNQEMMMEYGPLLPTVSDIQNQFIIQNYQEMLEQNS